MIVAKMLTHYRYACSVFTRKTSGDIAKMLLWTFHVSKL